MEHGAWSKESESTEACGSGHKTKNSLLLPCVLRLMPCALCLAPIINLQSKIYNLKSRVLLPKQSLDCLIDRLFS